MLHVNCLGTSKQLVRAEIQSELAFIYKYLNSKVNSETKYYILSCFEVAICLYENAAATDWQAV